jgi:hypothetical protein
VHAAAGEHVQNRGRDGGERLAFAGGHLRQTAMVQRDARGNLHVEGTHLQQPRRAFARRCEDLDQEFVVGGI